VLKRRVGVSREEIASTLDRLLRTELIVVADMAVVENALAAYRAGKGDFADYLIREQSKAAGATEVATFDRAIKGEAGFRVVA
jgi:predicted nucleic-acid-binding protein